MNFGEPLPANPRATTFIGGGTGTWRVISQRTLSGAPIASAARVEVIAGLPSRLPPDAAWTLWGVSTNDRYSTRAEKAELVSKQSPIGRSSATRAALILLSKSDEWWALAHDERRKIIEEDSHHIVIGLRYLPAISRRLLYCRDLETNAPFDFLGFLDYALSDASDFENLIGLLRTTAEWTFVNREIDLRLEKAGDDADL